MSFGKRMSWRLLPLLTVLAWAITSVGMAATAQAEASTNKTDHKVVGQNHQTDAQAAAPTTQAGDVAPASTPAAKHGSSSDAGTSGDVTSPQPISRADANTGGANGQCPGGPYCSTRDGSASENGNGGGNATGEPCAGCVGKADNKNPKGQMPDASDHNAGYECDTNQGIAKTNPAHTGCTTVTPPECVPTPEVPCDTPPECVPTPEVPCVSPPECVPTPEVPCDTPPECVPTPEVPCVSPPECVPTPEVPCVSPPTTQGGPTPPTQVSPPRSGLPDTGAPADLVWLAALALMSIVTGSGMLLGRRRTTKPAVQVTG
jgi:LPXTG-motif cell wall-anchored protein